MKGNQVVFMTTTIKTWPDFIDIVNLQDPLFFLDRAYKFHTIKAQIDHLNLTVLYPSGGMIHFKIPQPQQNGVNFEYFTEDECFSSKAFDNLCKQLKT